MKILVSAYACEPGLGSEIGVGWHWVLQMSRRFELWVLTRESNRRSIEPWIAAHPEYAGIHFLYFDLPRWARVWKRGRRGVRTYYNLWQLATNQMVRRVMRRNDIRIFHHLTYGNVLWRVCRYGSRRHFIWGPVGGLETIPGEFSCRYGRRSRLLEALRRSMVALTPLNLGFRRRCRRADLILCKTEFTRRLIPKKYASKAILFTDVATDSALCDVPAPQRADSSTRLVSVGHLDAWRGFDLAVEALAQARKQGADVSLSIVGNGPDRNRLERLIAGLGLSQCVSLTGKVSMERYRELMADSDVVVNGALKEGAVTVSFDAMAMGKPLICLDTTGYTRYFSSDCAVVIPRSSRREVVAQMADAMVRLSDADLRRCMGQSARTAAGRFSWDVHGREIADAILSSIPDNF